MSPVATKKGFTLMEVLVAVTILGLAFMVVMQNFSVSLDNIGRIEKVYDEDYAAMLELERLLVPGLEKEPPDGRVFVRGGRYQVIINVSGEGRKIETMRMERLR